MDALIRLSRKAANEWRNSDAYYQASVLIDSLCDRLEDSVPVVRCKDCKHFVHQENGYFCAVFSGYCYDVRFLDDFCSYGERKDGEA